MCWRSATLLTALCALALGCSEEETRAGASTGKPPPDCDADDPIACSCGDGFAPHPSGHGCIEVLAPEDCAPGSRPALGSATCVPVGWTSGCPAGTEVDPSG